MAQAIEDLPGRIHGALIGGMLGEAAAGTAAGGADLLGVAESVAATGGFDEGDLRQRGLERPSRGGAAGLLLRALPFGLFTPGDRPRLRRDAYRCISLAGADEATAVAAVAAAMLIADLTRFDMHTSLVRVRQSLLEDAPMALLGRLSVAGDAAAPAGSDPDAVLQAAISAADGAEDAGEAVRRAQGAAPVAMTLAGALAGGRGGRAGVAGVDVDHIPHGELAATIAHRLAERAAGRGDAVLETPGFSG